MSKTDIRKIKALLHIYNGDRKLDLEIAKIMGWSFLTNQKPEIGDWVGLSPSEHEEIIPFFSDDYDDLMKFVDFIKLKDPGLELVENCFPPDKEFFHEWKFMRKSGHKSTISTFSHSNYSYGLARCSVNAYKFLNEYTR
jgi:hypothetical protein